jgi:hypothetical protein
MQLRAARKFGATAARDDRCRGAQDLGHGRERIQTWNEACEDFHAKASRHANRGNRGLMWFLASIVALVALMLLASYVTHL